MGRGGLPWSEVVGGVGLVLALAVATAIASGTETLGSFEGKAGVSRVVGDGSEVPGLRGNPLGNQQGVMLTEEIEPLHASTATMSRMRVAGVKGDARTAKQVAGVGRDAKAATLSRMRVVGAEGDASAASMSRTRVAEVVRDASAATILQKGVAGAKRNESAATMLRMRIAGVVGNACPATMLRMGSAVLKGDAMAAVWSRVKEPAPLEQLLERRPACFASGRLDREACAQGVNMGRDGLPRSNGGEKGRTDEV